MDVHCCNCHSGFLFDESWCECPEADPPPISLWPLSEPETWLAVIVTVALVIHALIRLI